MAELTDEDRFEIWLALDLFEHAHSDDRPRLCEKLKTLLNRLRKEDKITTEEQDRMVDHGNQRHPA